VNQIEHPLPLDESALGRSLEVNSARRISMRSLNTETWRDVAEDAIVDGTGRGKLRPMVFTGAFLPV
jgi:hypothetical protein